MFGLRFAFFRAPASLPDKSVVEDDDSRLSDYSILTKNTFKIMGSFRKI